MTPWRAQRDTLQKSYRPLKKPVRLLALVVVGSWGTIAARSWVLAAAAAAAAAAALPPPCWTGAHGQVGQRKLVRQSCCQRLRIVSALSLQALQNADEEGNSAEAATAEAAATNAAALSADAASQRLRIAIAELQRAEAFKLPTVDALRHEVTALEAEKQVRQQQHMQQHMQQQPVKEQASHEPELQSSQQPDSGFDRVIKMSRQERLQLAFEYGPAFLVALAMVALCYWTLSFPVMSYAYHEATGEWPQLDQLGIEFYSDRTRGTATTVFAGAVGVAILLKPIRVLIALIMTPWIKENVLPLMGVGSDNDASSNGRRR